MTTAQFVYAIAHSLGYIVLFGGAFLAIEHATKGA